MRSRDKTAKLFGVSPRYIQTAKAVKKADPAMIERVKNGEITLNAAMNLLIKAGKITVKKKPAFCNSENVSDKFRDALNSLFRQVMVARKEGWVNSDRDEALRLIRTLGDMIEKE